MALPELVAARVERSHVASRVGGHHLERAVAIDVAHRHLTLRAFPRCERVRHDLRVGRGPPAL